MVSKGGEYKMKYIKTNFKYMVGILILLFCIFIILKIYYQTVRYSVVTLDDFIHYNGYNIIYPNDNFDLLNIAKKYALWDMLNLGGRYFTMFIQMLLGPNPYTDIVKKNSLVMVLNMYLYFSSLYVFIFTLVSKLIIKKSEMIKKIFISLLLYLSMLILHNVYHFYYEIFMWFSGATSYSIPFALLLLSLSFFIIYIETDKKIKYLFIIPTIITSIAALGGSISVLCVAFVMILSLFVYVIINKKIDIINLGLFFNYLTFALINICAPGNFIRLDVIINDEHLPAKIFDPERIIIIINELNKMLFDNWNRLFDKFAFIFILLTLTCFVGYWLSKNINTSECIKTFFTILPLAIMPNIVCLSFAIGYQDKIELFDRCFFLIDFSIIFSLIVILSFAFVLIFNFVNTEISIKLFQLLIIIIIVLNAFIVNCNKENGIEYKDVNKIQLITVAIDNSLNKYKDYYDEYKKVVETLRRNSGNDNVKIKNIDNDKAPIYFMKFQDGLHRPHLSNYVAYFYNIKQMILEE